jgi:hypothetical protein
MKKTGSYLSWIAFGILAQIAFVAITGFFFGATIGIKQFVVQTAFTVYGFFVLRALIDWETFDNPIEDYLRETMISNRLFDRVVFAFYGAFLLFIGNPSLWAYSLQALILGMPVITVLQNGFELVRINFVQEKKTNLSPSRGGE